MDSGNDQTRHTTAEGLLANGRRFLDRQEYEKAGGEYGQVCERWPERSEGHYGVALAARGLGELQLAFRAALEAVTVAPSFIEGYILVGELALVGGVADTAIDWVESAAKDNPTEAVLFEWLVRLYAVTGRLEDVGSCLHHYSLLRQIPLASATLLFARDPLLSQDVRSRISSAAGF